MKKALIVEDNPLWADILKRYCHAAELEPTVVRSPQSAMDSLDQMVPDVIILDMLLAAETGMALLNEMRSYDDLVNIPVVVCSSVATLSLEELAPYGVVSVMSKEHITPDGAARMLREVVYGQ